ncbi:hypothetical protein [Nocardia sp. NBC_01009]|uniref:hypothetical protein n=1 Tax=Nocardia sp. NBC_01009 TaxID=2975996 RepID=UPI0038684C52|nr:hypothetical protein OHA42_05090 [Nocardia sp. NBC_01009]
MPIPCTYKDGAPVSVVEADMIMRALGFTSARAAEEIIGAGERRRAARGIVTTASILGRQITQENLSRIHREARQNVLARNAGAA